MTVLSMIVLSFLAYSFRYVRIFEEATKKKVEYIVERERDRIVLRNRKGQFVKYLYYGE